MNYREAAREMLNTVVEYIERGRELQAQGCLDEAVVLLRDAVRKYPAEGYLQAQLGSVLWDTGDRQESIAAWRTSARLDADLECPRLILSFHLREVGQVEEAIRVLRDGLDACPRSRALWVCEMARIYRETGDPSRAISLYEEVLAFAPDDDRACRGREEAIEPLESFSSN